jgi:hypothetical protein
MWADGQTDIMKLIVAFYNLANVPENWIFYNKSIDVFDCNCLLTIQFESKFNIQ